MDDWERLEDQPQQEGIQNVLYLNDEDEEEEEGDMEMERGQEGRKVAVRSTAQLFYYIRYVCANTHICKHKWFVPLNWQYLLYLRSALEITVQGTVEGKCNESRITLINSQRAASSAAHTTMISFFS